MGGWDTPVETRRGRRKKKRSKNVSREEAKQERNKEEKREREIRKGKAKLAKKDFSKDPTGSNVAFIGLLSAKHWRCAAR